MQAPSSDFQDSGFKSDDIHTVNPAYRLVAQRDPEAFSAAVSKLIVEQQYKPVGGVFVAMSNNTPIFCQSMILNKYTQ